MNNKLELELKYLRPIYLPSTPSTNLSHITIQMNAMSYDANSSSKFQCFPHQDLSNHIKPYIGTLLTNVIVEDTYCLVWLSITLDGPTYNWSSSHATSTFVDLPTLQVAFLQQFQPATNFGDNSYPNRSNNP